MTFKLQEKLSNVTTYVNVFDCPVSATLSKSFAFVFGTKVNLKSHFCIHSLPVWVVNLCLLDYGSYKDIEIGDL